MSVDRYQLNYALIEKFLQGDNNSASPTVYSPSPDKFQLKPENELPAAFRIPAEFRIREQAYKPRYDERSDQPLLPLPPLDASKVNLDALYELGGVVLEPVPPEQRDRYRYWRGAHLGKIAMNFARGIQTLNAGRDPVMHFTDGDYDYARYTATDMKRLTQFSAEDAAELSALTGREPDAPLPRIVYALDERYNDGQYHPSTMGMGDGVILPGHLTLSLIDEYSRAAIRGLLAPPNGALPEPPY
jgi:hypothetical protein